MSCITAGEFIAPEWYKNGTDIGGCDNIILKSVPQTEIGKNIYQLTISSFDFNMQGEYMLKLANRSCIAYIRPIKDIFSTHLVPQTGFFGEDVKFECTLAVDEGSSTWLIDKRELTWYCQTEYYRQKHALVIKSISFEDEGTYSIEVRNVSSHAKLNVKDKLLIKTEDIYYLLSVYAISKIATPAVRYVFNTEFHPDTLHKTIRTNIGKLSLLRQSKHINLEDWKLLLKNRGDSPLTSDLFDLRLMILLLRNIASFEILNSLPERTNTSVSADLSRIHYYRNIIAHNQRRLSNEDLKQCLKDLMEAAERLTISSSSVEKTQQQLWFDNLHSPDELTKAVKALLDRNPTDIPEIARKISIEERDFLRIVFLLYRVACPAVRYKFNTIFLPEDLVKTLNENVVILETLKKDKRITQSQWSHLFPKKDTTTSKDFELKLMLILIRTLKPTYVNDEEMEALKSLESYLYTVARSNSGKVSEDNFDDYCKDICAAIILMGGHSYGKRFTNICCFLHTDTMEYLQTFFPE
ncbi:uncharacterized protein LOC143082264 [Mytilus galloprovincialis]|uniref:uncharacterized protein LOC143082264 n=1 Tax=Mytilus galloprovincialis TaxID=29158 RepID=UPI003F7B7A56